MKNIDRLIDLHLTDFMKSLQSYYSKVSNF
jgi:hypothetical protein